MFVRGITCRKEKATPPLTKPFLDDIFDPEFLKDRGLVDRKFAPAFFDSFRYRLRDRRRGNVLGKDTAAVFLDERRQVPYGGGNNGRSDLHGVRKNDRDALDP